MLPSRLTRSVAPGEQRRAGAERDGVRARRRVGGRYGAARSQFLRYGALRRRSRPTPGSGLLRGGCAASVALATTGGPGAASRAALSGASVSRSMVRCAAAWACPDRAPDAHSARIAVSVASGACGAGRGGGRAAGAVRASVERLITRPRPPVHSAARWRCLPSSSSATTPTRAASAYRHK